MSTVLKRAYLLAVVVLGLVNAVGVVDPDVMFALCLALTLPCSLFTAGVLFYGVAPLLAFLGVPSAAAQFVVDFGYAAVGGFLNVLLVRVLLRAGAAVPRKCLPARAAR
ncbi:hypothetical protein GCM10010358_57790 [Streptomyces minutiscleroticus]|uniref:Uncharacterized protein n=1 Tax=Streptomyces minutiscleroticus TaxID=68238 RepID=A0A918U5U2_9ACTN|nr:hypothetical protein [Streptomyces minutiscleroticus]GGX96430.1 hypothetical protein GCM10010358_57790 [Streptomyces minutiscleroticus]